MKTTLKLKAVLFFVIACMITTVASAQTPAAKPIASPRDSVSGVIASANITINYGSPSVRGRVIWGNLEPYDTVWRAGANEATTFTTTRNIKVNGKVLPAGKYGFFLIPSKKKWTVIFNSVPNQWGAFKYDATKDVLRIMVKPETAPMQERLIYTVTNKGFSMTWDKVTIPVKVTQ